MRNTTFRSICLILVLTLLVTSIPSTIRGEGDVPIQKIYGTVTEFNDVRSAGEPVPGAEVYIEQEPNEEPTTKLNQTKTNSKGYFEFWQKAGEYRITIKTSGFKKISKVISVLENEDLQVNIDMIPGVDEYDVDMDPDDISKEVKPGGSIVVHLKIKNIGNTSDSYNVSIKGEKMPWASMGTTRSTSNGGPYSQSVSNLEDDGIADIDINLTAPEDAEPGNYTFTVTARSYWNQQVTDEAKITLTVGSSEPEPGIIDDEEEDESGLPFLGLPALLLLFLLGGALRRKRFNF